jgi:UDP-glucose 4-epimerase
VALTGATGDLGQLLVPLLLADEGVEKVVAIDIAKPKDAPKLAYRRIDLTHHEADRQLAEALEEEEIDALYHLAFLWTPRALGNFAHELEVIGTMHVLAAAGNVELKRLILPSLTALYGAAPSNPARLTERHPLKGCAGSRFITDRVEVEHQLEAFAVRHPKTQIVVLRFAPIVGAHSDNPFTRLLRAPVVPTVLGFDPPWQTVAEEDAFHALHLALDGPAVGVFNVVGDEEIPLSSVIRLAHGRPLPLPGPVLRQTIRVLETANVASVPAPLLNYFRYPMVADGRKAAQRLGYSARVPVRQALDAVPMWGKN